MSAAITMAHEKNCYTLSDKGTHLNRDDTDLISHEFTNNLTLNQYSIILLETKYLSQSEEFSDFLFRQGSSIIENYSINGERLFYLV